MNWGQIRIWPTKIIHIQIRGEITPYSKVFLNIQVEIMPKFNLNVKFSETPTLNDKKDKSLYCFKLENSTQNENLFVFLIRNVNCSEKTHKK